MEMKEVKLAGSIELILLFILGLPGRIKAVDQLSPASEVREDSDGISAVVAVDEDVLLHSLEFSTKLAPQDTKVRIRIFGREGKEEKNVEIDIIPGASVTELHWEDWANVAMGFMK